MGHDIGYNDVIVSLWLDPFGPAAQPSARRPIRFGNKIPMRVGLLLPEF